ncbi:hypothetical protein PAXRUDRAFT_272888 [Paxillus rubicundulus Ve08.2h10]|uniref:Uncharacterized protein n=1 Tax=Paxillus rubicundulus Ve08.2h10 TaxID=930991 RepID=A0A0D0D7G8_9AGAM|nr:hypothetical protein PAXRUDRAFT_272888 [Paxillus rubicundulus Ve08.2h10]
MLKVTVSFDSFTFQVFFCLLTARYKQEGASLVSYSKVIVAPGKAMGVGWRTIQWLVTSSLSQVDYCDKSHMKPISWASLEKHQDSRKLGVVSLSFYHLF